MPQALSAQSWPRKNSDSIKAIFAEMIEAYLSSRQSLEDAVEYGSKKISNFQ